MSDTTNPHKLIAQYKKAQKIAVYLVNRGQTTLDASTYTEDDRHQLMLQVGLASVPSEAVVALAAVLVPEYAEIVQDMIDAR